MVSLPDASEGDGLLPTVVNFAFCFSLVCLVCGSMDLTCLLSSHPPDERWRKDTPERRSNQSDIHSSGGFTLPSVVLFIVLNRVLIKSSGNIASGPKNRWLNSIFQADFELFPRSKPRGWQYVNYTIGVSHNMSRISCLPEVWPLSFFVCMC